MIVRLCGTSWPFPAILAFVAFACPMAPNRVQKSTGWCRLQVQLDATRVDWRNQCLDGIVVGWGLVACSAKGL